VWGDGDWLAVFFRRVLFYWSFWLAGRVLLVGGAAPAWPQTVGSTETVDWRAGGRFSWGAGDIAGCQNPQGALQTGEAFMRKIPGPCLRWRFGLRRFTLGQFQNCYGRRGANFKRAHGRRWGNHEYRIAVQLLY